MIDIWNHGARRSSTTVCTLFCTAAEHLAVSKLFVGAPQSLHQTQGDSHTAEVVLENGTVKPDEALAETGTGDCANARRRGLDRSSDCRSASADSLVRARDSPVDCDAHSWGGGEHAGPRSTATRSTPRFILAQVAFRSWRDSAELRDIRRSFDG
jgi:hypothetical protein